MSNAPIDLPERTRKTRRAPESLRIPTELEPYIEAGIARTGRTRHGYLIGMLEFAVRKERPTEVRRPSDG